MMFSEETSKESTLCCQTIRFVSAREKKPDENNACFCIHRDVSSICVTQVKELWFRNHKPTLILSSMTFQSKQM